MPQGIGLDAREATAALRERTQDRLELGFGRLVESEARASGWDPRDTMISLTPFLDCARRLGLDPGVVLGPIALILAGVVIRAGVFAPATVERLLDGEEAEGS